MSAAPDLSLALRGLYRGPSAAEADPARHYLKTAADALSLALLTLGGDPDASRGQRRARAEAARGFLVEAVTALSRARIYNPRVRTQAVPFVMATEGRVEAELVRLHNIATRLMWQNHVHLPARLQAKPLGPEDEAQLADVLAGLRQKARLGRVSRYRWAGAIFAAGAVGMALSLPVLGGALMGASIVQGTLQALQGGRRQPLALTEA